MRTLKRWTGAVLSLLMTVMLAACGSAAPPGNEAQTAETGTAVTAEKESDLLEPDDFAELKPVALVYADGAAVGAVGNLYAKAFIKNVDKITGGKIKIDYYGNAQFGGDSEIAAQMLKGTIDLTNMQPGNVSSLIPELYVFDLPMAFAKYDTEAIDRVLKPGSEFFTSLNGGFNKAGFELLDTLQAATFREMSSNKAVRTIDDFNGIRIRTMSSEYALAFWESLGCDPEAIDFTDLYMSLQQDIVEAEENALDTQANSKFYEVQDYIVLTHHTLYLSMFYAAKERWNSLDPLYQQAIIQASLAADAELQPKLKDINDKSQKTMEENGVEVIKLDDDVLDAIIEKAQPVYDSVRNAVGEKICDQLIEGLEAAAQ